MPQEPVQILYAVPVGAIIAWYPPASAKLPPDFALCDGQLINDPGSPFNNMNTPDLSSRFILGATSVGTPPLTGGSPDVAAGGYVNNAYETTTGSTIATSNDNTLNEVIIQNNISQGYRYGMVEEGANGIHDGNHSHQYTVMSFYVPAPGWVALMFIMRIK